MFHIAQYFPITDPTLIFFVVLLIILFAPIIMGKLRIPHIIGMVLAGVLIGKYGLNILERDSSFELFGKVGLYYIMFLAALEMDMEGMKKNKSRLLIYGLLTCFIPFFLTYGMSIWLLHYSAKASFLLSCIMASNTLIAYPIVSRYGLQQKPSVTLSVGSSMISLLIALIMLAGLVASFSKHDGVLFWVFFTLKFAVYCGVMIMPDSPTYKMVLAKIQRCGDAVYLRTFDALYECGTFADSGHRRRFRCFLRRSDIKQIYSACFATDEPPRVYRQCPLHSLFPDRCGHANQYQSAVSGQSYPMGRVLYRLLRNPGQSYRSLYRLFRVSGCHFLRVT